MKLKTVLTMAAATMVTQTAYAVPNQTVYFTGAVTKATCDVGIVIDGTAVTSKLIELGTTEAGTASAAKTAPPVDFTIMLYAPGTTGTCTLTDVTNVVTEWSSPTMSANGIDNVPGSDKADKAFVALAAKETGVTDAVNSSARQQTFTKALAADGITYTATLTSPTGGGEGRFYAPVTYNVIFD